MLRLGPTFARNVARLASPHQSRGAIVSARMISNTPIVHQAAQHDDKYHGHHHHEKDVFENWQFKLIGASMVVGAFYLLLAPKSAIHGHEQEKEEQTEAPAAEAVSEDKAPQEQLAPAAATETAPEAAPEVVATEAAPEAAPEAVAEPPKPKYSGPLPLYYHYVIVGTGTSGLAAAKAIQESDPNAEILLIGEENEVPYTRTPLTKELWQSEDPDIGKNLIFRQWNGIDGSLFYEKPEFFADALSEEGKTSPGKIKLIKNHAAVSLNLDTQLVTLDNGQKVYYQKLLLATGGRARQLPAVKKLPEDAQSRVTTFRRLADFRGLDSVTAQGNSHIAIIAGGFLGSELACAIAHRAKKVSNLRVTQVFPEDGNMALVLPKYLSQWATEKVRQEGVNVIPKVLVSDILPREGGVTLLLSNGESVEADHVVAAIGLETNIELAKKAGLEIDERRGGVIVNAELEARKNVFVSGDLSSYPDAKLGRRRVEHYEHAEVSGKVAGENMAGSRKSYTHQPRFWSDLGSKVSFEAVGLVDSSLESVGVWEKSKDKSNPDEFSKGIVYYLKDKKVVGVLTWNTFGKIDQARQIIKEGKEFENLKELSKLIKP